MPANAVCSFPAVFRVAMLCEPQLPHSMPKVVPPSPPAVPTFHAQLAALFGLPWVDTVVLCRIHQLLPHALLCVQRLAGRLVQQDVGQ